MDTTSFESYEKQYNRTIYDTDIEHNLLIHDSIQSIANTFINHYNQLISSDEYDYYSTKSD